MARFVFVHGAFGGAWSLEPLREPLEAAGHTVETFDLPGGGNDETPPGDVTLASCAQRVSEVLASKPEPAILVGYSMGGAVVTQAASNTPEHVAVLVFVAAFMPGDGQSLLDLTQLPEGAEDMIQANIVIEGEPPVATLPAEAALQAIYNCCTTENATVCVARQRPQPVAPFADPVSVDDALLASIPRFYVLTTQDNSIPPALQRRMIAEHPCRNVVELDTDHAPAYSGTADLVAALSEFAGDLRPA
ncbi:MAG TPA: alpha/beta fold hydrolase [Gaiellaceae bacterium]|nr:alpha/beta fold hydrolase [Gaiellaceae bacterium]